ncbi:MAG: DUF4097 family beta strand repeat-containing protein [Chloroflexota bacterium]
MTDNEQYTDPAEIRHRIGANGVFSLGNVSGDIRLRGTDTDEVIAIARSDHGRSDKLPLVVRRSEGSLSIEIDQRGPLPFGLGWRGVPGVDFEITVPRGARVDVNSVSSDIDVTGLVGEQSYKTVSGDLQVMNVGGRLSLTSVSGDIEVGASEPIEADVSSTSGDLDVSGPVLRAMRLRTVSGDIEIRGAFDTGAQHNVETVSGDVEIESTTGLTVEVRKGIDLGGGPKQRVVGDGAARLRFRSLSGDLHVAGSSPEKGVKDVPYTPFTPPAPPTPPAAPAPFAQERQAADSLEILRALERGEIDIEEASRRLEGSNSRG